MTRQDTNDGEEMAMRRGMMQWAAQFLLATLAFGLVALARAADPAPANAVAGGDPDNAQWAITLRKVVFTPRQGPGSNHFGAVVVACFGTVESAERRDPLLTTEVSPVDVRIFIPRQARMVRGLIIHAANYRLAEIPGRARFPLTVKVVAYQLGRDIEPRVKPASTVEPIVPIQANSR